ncbi:MAG TPA: ribosomal protein S18-alanine N-acetyltransferase [Dissulfurispiraceae bacterium]|nr:ribosomal protein S18-alanine N-acetyltransferase [Dissulfurispiraceae bacterium]
MTPADIPQVIAIERASFSNPWSENSFLGEIHHRDALTWVVEIDGTIAGYLCARKVLDEWHLHDLAVAPDRRRQGIATVLSDNAESEMRRGGGRSLYLEVRVSNLSARGFYERRGFRVLGTRKAYYSEPVEDALMMVLDLDRELPRDHCEGQ